MLERKPVNIYEAKTHLSSLIDQAASGEDVILARNGRSLARITSLGAPYLPLKHPGPLPKPITLKGEGPSASESLLMDREG